MRSDKSPNTAASESRDENKIVIDQLISSSSR